MSAIRDLHPPCAVCGVASVLGCMVCNHYYCSDHAAGSQHACTDRPDMGVMPTALITESAALVLADKLNWEDVEYDLVPRWLPDGSRTSGHATLTYGGYTLTIYRVADYLYYRLRPAINGRGVVGKFATLQALFLEMDGDHRTVLYQGLLAYRRQQPPDPA